MYKLGGRSIHRIGFGAMQLPGPGVWGPPRDRDEAIAVLRRAAALGADHIDTAQYYGPDVANDLIRDALCPYAEGMRIVTKVGARRGEDGAWLPSASPAALREQVDANLRSLGVESLALVNLRLAGEGTGMENSGVPMEESLGALAEMRDDGKLELIGLSAGSVQQLEAACEVTPIAGVQDRFNLLDRHAHDRLEACRSRGLAFVPFFPLGSAFTRGPALLAADPVVAGIAARYEVSAAQVALAWLLAVGPHVLLIPGTSSVSHLEENVGAARVRLTDADMAALDALAAPP